MIGASMETPVLRTPRLVLRPLAPSDAPVVQRRFPRWEIVQHLVRVPWPYPADGAETFLAGATEEIRTGFKAHWALIPRDGPDELIGIISLWPERPPERDQRGFWLDPEFQGQGLMSEAADRVTDHALRTLGWPGLWLTNSLDNRPSARVKERQGARLVDTEPASYVRGPGTRQIWRLDAEDWLAKRPRAPRD
ncbi:GNAT family N-acetyltransferase [Caulobacter sp. NIBR1757]|uniref:GNAT family N-acetyltransferase n=1 Tax=Caulobacter sp. NIBR1757 TaxID=3016000 RepID=UPI0022F07D5C|nr:GNAT family N-acetyltransferase [Caulobacter sp. NIBR1757]WGM38203.1 hypothetical protein AMEJIAPC_01105 [Caulobacter sp. NIBR1757]